eukprot:483828-Prymnesium_polylepis.1
MAHHGSSARRARADRGALRHHLGRQVGAGGRRQGRPRLHVDGAPPTGSHLRTTAQQHSAL